jgi:hypothetical protein
MKADRRGLACSTVLVISLAWVLLQATSIWAEEVPVRMPRAWFTDSSCYAHLAGISPTHLTNQSVPASC